MISTCLAKTTGTVTANTATTDYQIFTGTPGSEGDGGWTSVPEAISRYTLGNNTWCMLLRVNNSWELVPFTNHVSNVTLSGTVADGATQAVTLSNGRSVTATNRSGVSLAAGNAVAIYDMVDDEWMLTGGGTGGGSGTNTKLYYGLLYVSLDASDLDGQAFNLTSYTTGIADVAGPITFENPFNCSGASGDVALLAYHDGQAAYHIIRVEDEGRDETIEAIVYTPFGKESPTFSAQVIRSYTGYTAADSLITVYNQVDPMGPDHSYLFEGEFGAVCRVQWDRKSQVYRAVWVECPEDSPVSEESSGQITTPLSMFSESAVASQGVF